MIIYSLYVKTHIKTGLKYLGQTKQNPYTYKGSGIRWNNHINKHDNNVWTNVIFQTEIKDEIKEIGLYYSNLWNVVKSKDWANLKPESGDGGWFFTTEELSEIHKETSKRPETIEKKRQAQLSVWNNPLYRQKVKIVRSTPDYKIKKSLSAKKAAENWSVFECKICNVFIKGDGNFSQHNQSKSHLKKLECVGVTD